MELDHKHSAASPSNQKPRPFVFINVAMTVDGKLAPANRRFVPFSSRRDQELLMQLRTDADAVMAGARTVDLGEVDLGPGAARWRKLRLKKGLAEHNLRVIVSGSGSINPKAHIFQKRFSPIIILTTERASKRSLKVLTRLADEVKICGQHQLDFTIALRWLREKWDIKKLLCEGGGELNEALFRCGLVDELFVTISPLVFGGRDAPTLADGRGIESLSDAASLQLRSLKRCGDDLFLKYQVNSHG
jgi:2,5-diamino-6-(ribosylamino)-4(3H)-pyrimidinone 5'-phosphate reductase